ncbi:MAG: class I SAM-dependent methyltransferase [bacterium]|nr:class I SAM-dependent methyltransferase [bacterium]
MEERKLEEIKHYDEDAKNWHGGSSDIQGVDVMMMAGYREIYRILESEVAGKTVLDYGCGHGMHSVSIARFGGKVTGVDLSEESLKIAKGRTEKEGFGGHIQFVAGDCEALPFADQSFDIVFDGGTFSSLDIEKAFSEIARVLKPGGLLIGIETLGHNPLANFKRWINKKRGTRTGWAADHIMKMFDLDRAKKYFDILETRFFHFFSMFAFPFRNMPGGKMLFRALDKIDNVVLKIPFLKRYSFKIVFVFSAKGVSPKL